MPQITLRRFQEIVRCGSVRAAAERLNVTPSALSREVAKTEEELGVALFERQPRGMVMTPAGEIYLNHARDVLLGVERMRSELEALQGLRRGKISLLSVEGYAPDFLAHAIVRFQERHPGLVFSLRITGTNEVIAGIASGEADIGLAFNLEPAKGIRSMLRLQAPLLAVMTPSHPLASARRLTLADLAQERLALPDASFGVRRLIDMQTHIANVRLEPVLETNSLAVLRGFARHEGGVTLLSRMSTQTELQAGQLVGIPLSDQFLKEGNIDICVLADRKLPVAAAEFLKHLTQAGEALALPSSHPRAPRASADRTLRGARDPRRVARKTTRRQK